MAMISYHTFYHVQMHYALPVIKETWNDIQSENIERAEGKAVVVTKGTGAICCLSRICHKPYRICHIKWN